MSIRFRDVMLVISAAVVVAIFALAVSPTAGQAPAAYRAPRTADGHPDLNGIWQAVNTANWNIESHGVAPALAVRPSRVEGTVVPAAPVLAFGAVGGVPAGLGIVEGGEIPYQPAAAAKKKENSENWLLRDPKIKCFLPGVPHGAYDYRNLKRRALARPSLNRPSEANTVLLSILTIISSSGA